jgi:hypothetical protein
MAADDEALRAAAFRQVRRLQEVHDTLTSEQLAVGFVHEGTRYPLVNPHRLRRRRAARAPVVSNSIPLLKILHAASDPIELGTSAMQRTPKRQVGARALRKLVMT